VPLAGEPDVSQNWRHCGSPRNPNQPKPRKQQPCLSIGQVFILHMRPEVHYLDSIKALRAVLKYSLRAHGLRCVTLQMSDSVGFVLPEGDA
jgi:hypothetical protein